MERSSFRLTVTTGTFTLPVMAVLTFIIWMVPAPSDWRLWAGLAMAGATAAVVMELNNRFTLLRVRSRMISCTYLLLLLLCPQLHPWIPASVLSLCTALSYAALFPSYQDSRAVGHVYHAFLFAGIASLFFPYALILALLLYVSMLVQLRNLTWRTFTAGLLGLLTPYWIYAVWALLQGRIVEVALEWWANATPRIPDYSGIAQAQWLTLGTIGFFALLAMAHLFRTAYNDKIRTRMLYYLIAMQEAAVAAGFLALPDRFDELLRLFVLNSAFLIAHYYTIGKGRFFHIWFNVSLLALMALGVYNGFFA